MSFSFQNKKKKIGNRSIRIDTVQINGTINTCSSDETWKLHLLIEADDWTVVTYICHQPGPLKFHDESGFIVSLFCSL